MSYTPGPIADDDFQIVRMSTKRIAIINDNGREVVIPVPLATQAPAMLEALKLAKVRLEGGNAAERAFNAGIVNVLNNVITQAEGKRQ